MPVTVEPLKITERMLNIVSRFRNEFGMTLRNEPLGQPHNFA